MIQPQPRASSALVVGDAVVVAKCRHAIMPTERNETKSAAAMWETCIALDRKMTMHIAQSQRVNHVG
jgi:hypothetical protein